MGPDDPTEPGAGEELIIPAKDLFAGSGERSLGDTTDEIFVIVEAEAAVEEEIDDEVEEDGATSAEEAPGMGTGSGRSDEGLEGVIEGTATSSSSGSFSLESEFAEESEISMS